MAELCVEVLENGLRVTQRGTPFVVTYMRNQGSQLLEAQELLALPELTQVELHFARPYEISIEVSEEALRRHALSFDAVAEAVRRSSLDVPGGRLRTRLRGWSTALRPALRAPAPGPSGDSRAHKRRR